MPKDTRKSNNNRNGSNGRELISIDPDIVYFTHARIRPFFTGCGKRIEDTLTEIRNGRVSISDLPLITVIESNGAFFSLNNRRLYVLKQLRSEGLLQGNAVQVQLKSALEREKKKYAVERCSLSARIMKEFQREGGVETLGDPVLQGDREIPSADCDTFDSHSITSGAMQPQDASITVHHERKSSGKGQKSLTSSGSALNESYAKEMKMLKSLVSKKKIKAAMSQVDEWEMNGTITAQHRQFICETVGLPT